MRVLDKGNSPRLWRTQAVCKESWDDRCGCGATLEVSINDLWLGATDRSSPQKDAWGEDLRSSWLGYWEQWIGKRTASFKCPECRMTNTIIVSENVFHFMYGRVSKEKVKQ